MSAQAGDSPLSDEHVGPRVVRGGMQRAAGFAATNLLSVAGAIVLLRYLGVDAFGRYGTVMALVNIVYGISDAGLTITGSRELAMRDDADERRRVLADVLTMRMVLAGAGVVFAVLFTIVAGYDHDLVIGTLLAGSGAFLASVQSALLLPLAVDLRNGRVALNEVLRQGILVSCWGLLAVLGAGLVPFFAAQLFLGVVLVSIAPLLVGRRALVAPRWDPVGMVPLIRVALPIAIANVLGVVYLRLLVVLMSLLSTDAKEVGYYVTSTRIVELAAGLPFLLVTVVLPVVTVAARDDPVRMRYMTVRLTETMALGGILVVLVTEFAAKPVVLLLGGSGYEGAIPVLRIQSLAILTIFLTAAWNPALVGLGRVRSLVLTTGTGVVAVVITGLVLIPPLGAEGAATAAVVADLFLCIATYLALRRGLPEPPVNVRILARISLAAIPAAALWLVPGLPDIAGAILAPAVFLGACASLGAIPSELLDSVRRRR